MKTKTNKKQKKTNPNKINEKKLNKHRFKTRGQYFITAKK